MRYSRWNVKILTLLLCCLVAAGCGNDNTDFVFNPSTTPTVNGTVAGKLFLGTPIPNVPITVETFDGRALASTTTDRSGNFVLQGSFPADFRVAARPESESSVAFFREVRGFNSEGVFAAITVQTSLASLLAQAQPSTPLADHEAAVRRGLGLRENESLAKLNESVNEKFSQLAFFAEARQNGGVQAYIEQLLASEGLDRPLRLRHQTLNVDLSGLPPALAGPLGRLQNDPDLRTSTLRLAARGLPDSPTGAIFYRRVTPPTVGEQQVLGQFGEVVAAIGEVAEDVGESLLEDVGEDAVDSIFDAITGNDSNGDDDDDQGQTYSAAQIAYFVGGDLNEVIQQLTDIQSTASQILDSLQAAAQTATQAALQNDFKTANTFVDTIEGYQNNLVVGVNEALGQDSYFDNQPGTLPQNVQTTVAQLQNAQSITELTQAVNSLGALLGGADSVPPAVIGQSYPPVLVNTSSDGTPSAARPNLVLAQRDALFEPLGIVVDSDTQVFANFPVRSAALLDQVLGPWEGYAQSQILGANLIAEAAHLSSNPVPNIELARAYANNVAINLKETRAQIPDYPVSEDYIIDVQAGLCWYAVVQAPNQDVVSITENFDDGIHQDWRLPSPLEMQSLLLRVGVAAGDGRYVENPDLQDVVNGLQALGFDTTQMSSTDSFLFSFDYELNGSTWTTPSTDGGILYSLTGDYRSNLVNNLSGFSPGSTVPHSFILCRTVGEQPTFDCLQFEANDTTTLLNPGPGTWPDDFVTNDVQDDELPSLGVCIGIDKFLADDSSYILPLADWQINTGSSSYALGDVTFSTDYVYGPTYLQKQILPPTYFQTVDTPSGRADRAGIELSNFASTFGNTLRHANAAAGTNVTWTTLGLDDTGAFPRRLTGERPNYYETPQPQIEPQQIQISPRNVRINVPLVGTSQQFVVTGFNQDQTVVDLTGQVTWSVTAEGGGAAVGASFSTQTPGLLNLQDVANATQNLVITAQLANPSLTDTTNVNAVH